MHFRRFFLVLLLLPAAAHAARLAGDVRDPKGGPVAGALVTLRDIEGRYAETVYSDEKGHFELWTSQHGRCELRVRHSRYKDFLEKEFSLPPSRVSSIRLQLTPFASAQELSDSLPAIAHAATI